MVSVVARIVSTQSINQLLYSRIAPSNPIDPSSTLATFLPIRAAEWLDRSAHLIPEIPFWTLRNLLIPLTILETGTPYWTTTIPIWKMNPHKLTLVGSGYLKISYKRMFRQLRSHPVFQRNAERSLRSAFLISAVSWSRRSAGWSSSAVLSDELSSLAGICSIIDICKVAVSPEALAVQVTPTSASLTHSRPLGLVACVFFDRIPAPLADMYAKRISHTLAVKKST